MLLLARLNEYFLINETQSPCEFTMTTFQPFFSVDGTIQQHDSYAQPKSGTSLLLHNSLHR